MKFLRRRDGEILVINKDSRGLHRSPFKQNPSFGQKKEPINNPDLGTTGGPVKIPKFNFDENRFYKKISK